MEFAIKFSSLFGIIARKFYSSFHDLIFLEDNKVKKLLYLIANNLFTAKILPDHCLS